MNHNAKVMLEALRYSPNGNTSEHAIDILENRKVSWATNIPAVELASNGALGDFIASVMRGDLRDAWNHADQLNQYALSNVIPEEYRK